MIFKEKYQKQAGIITMMLLMFAFMPRLILAQSSVEIGLHGGVAYYNGDINPALPFVMPLPTYGILARYNIDDRWTVKLMYSHAKVQGDDLVSKAVNNRFLNFVTTINDLSLTGEFNFMNYFTGSKKSNFTPYLMGGVGAFLYTPKGKDGAGNLFDLRSLGTEGQNDTALHLKVYKKYSFALVFGLGFKYSLTRRLGLGVEWSMHKTFTDYLDDVSTTYYLDGTAMDPSSLTAEEYFSDPSLSHFPGEQRGNSSTKDWFGFTNLTVTYKIDLVKNRGCNSLKW